MKTTKLTAILNTLFLIIITILIVMSLLSMVIIHWTFFRQSSFSFTPGGINNYLTRFGEYKALFTATVATFATYFGLHRLKAATDANIQKIKQDRFTEWKSVLDTRLVVIEDKDPFMKNEFIRIRYDLFEKLYDLDFNLENRSKMEEIFHVLFNPLVNLFEQQNYKCIGMGGIYPNRTYAYSYDSFLYLFLTCVNKLYEDFESDLNSLYLSCISANRISDDALYQTAWNNYLCHE